MVTSPVRTTHPSSFTVLLDVEQRLKYDVANNHSAFVRQRDREREAEQLKVRCIMQPPCFRPDAMHAGPQERPVTEWMRRWLKRRQRTGLRIMGAVPQQ